MTDEHVGVVGPDADSAADVVESAGGRARVDGAAAVLDAGVDTVAALSESALYALVRAGLSTGTPVVPVNTGRGVGSVPPGERDRALRRLVRGEYEVRERPTLAVDVHRERHRALADVMLTTHEAAHISEYALSVGDERDAADVDTVRADGVVVATPAGSQGYSRAADGPVVSPAVDAVSVVPVAPFRVESANWVLPLPVTLTVERDETPVSLLVDDRDVGLVDSGAPVEIGSGAPVSVAVTSDPPAFFDGGSR